MSREISEVSQNYDRVAQEKKEINRLKKQFKKMPENLLKTVDGLIVQAARLRVSLDILSADIAENGMTEMFQQSEKVEPYERERPAASLFLKCDKNYQQVMKQLTDLVPPDPTAGRSKLGALMRDE